MLTGKGYRGSGLTRIGHTERWQVSGEGDYSWNEAIDKVDAGLEDPPDERVTCKLCGDYELLGWLGDLPDRLKRKSMCFTCNHWDEWFLDFAKDDNKTMFINGGRAYTICDESKGGGRWSGFGGRKFNVKFKTGRVVDSTNLWTQGEIPKRFSKQDTAELC